MPESSAATPLPNPNPGSNQPNLSVVPETGAAGPRFSGLTQRQMEELTKASNLVLAAQRAEYAAAVSGVGITAAFLSGLTQQIAGVIAIAQQAVDADAARKTATQEEQAAAATLLTSLRAIQAAARLQHLPANPAALESYHAGETLDASQPVFQTLSQSLINKVNEERPGSVDTNFVNRVQNERANFVSKNAKQTTEKNRAQQSRLQRDEAIKAVATERRKIQYAADRLWPAGQVQNAQARADFQLPANRPFSY